MNLNDTRFVIARLADGVVESPEEFNVRLNFGHRQNFSNQWEKILATPEDQRDYSPLRYFKKVLGGVTPPLYVSGGYADLPKDYFGKESATVFYGGEEKTVEFLEDKRFDERKKDAIEGVDPEYPLGNIQSNFIRFLPKSIQFVDFSYITAPKGVKFAYKSDRGFIEYDPVNSIELPWDEEQVTNIIMLILSDMGINKTREQVKKAQKE